MRTSIDSISFSTMGGEKRFAVLLCAEDSEYIKENYGGYFGVFLNMLAEKEEQWDLYRVFLGEVPGDDIVEGYEGFVITGSCSDAHGDDKWISNLMSLIRKLDSLEKKVLGICFGHQILSRALGGKIERSTTGWDIGVRTIDLSTSSNLFGSINLPKQLSIIQCHRDEITELPLKAEVLASSKKTSIEMFRYGNHAMGIQGHPEYTNDILCHLLDRLLQHNLITESYAMEMKDNVEALEPAREEWKKLCTRFLKGRL